MLTSQGTHTHLTPQSAAASGWQRCWRCRSRPGPAQTCRRTAGWGPAHWVASRGGGEMPQKMLRERGERTPCCGTAGWGPALERIAGWEQSGGRVSRNAADAAGCDPSSVLSHAQQQRRQQQQRPGSNASSRSSRSRSSRSSSRAHQLASHLFNHALRRLLPPVLHKRQAHRHAADDLLVLRESKGNTASRQGD